MVVTVMAEIPGLQYYLFVIVALLLGSILYNLKQRLAINKREATETALVKEAYFHPISELPNRKNIDIMITEQIHRVHRRAQSFIIVIIRIKNYNDINMRSKSEGDEFISEAGTRVVDSVRDEDMVAHISDSSFAILFNEYLEEENYEILFKRLKNVFKDEFQIAEKRTLMYDIGFGYSQYPDNGTDGDTLITEATHQALK